jgi:RNase P subunit RPR2
VVRRTHYCRRCGAAIDPGDVYAAVDVLDAEGRLRTLLCRSCGADLRAFVDGRDGDRESDDPSTRER